MKNIKSEDEFNDLANKGSVYVQFSANWCGPCKMLTKTIESIEDSQEDISFLKVDVDSHREIAQNFGVRSIPRVILLKDGKQVGDFVGAKNENDLKEIFQKTFK
jgi:thioredoxin 1